MYLEHENDNLPLGQAMTWEVTGDRLMAKANDHISQAGALEAAHDGNPDDATRKVIVGLENIGRLERMLGKALIVSAGDLRAKKAADDALEGEERVRVIHSDQVFVDALRKQLPHLSDEDFDALIEKARAIGRQIP